MAETVSSAVGMVRMGADTKCLPRSLFGQNLEHTRSCIYQGLSAQLIRNRKFAGKPSRDGVASEWLPWGEGMFYEMLWKSIFLKHETSEYGQMPRRNECFTQGVSNYGGTPGGIRQTGLALSGGEKYTLRIAWRNGGDKGTVETLVKLSGNGIVFLQEKVSGITSDWSIAEFHFTCECDTDAELSIGLDACGSVWLGMVSLMSDNNFRGMRPDVIAHLKAIGTSLIRWPGGNFAGEYLWRDGLLPADERKPSQSFMEIETQPYTNGFDYNELGTDDIIALCREIGAEPFFTINPVWFSPEESAAWVEYCNGSADTPLGKLRAERGFPEPFNVRFWSLGNEMGFGHMEGTKNGGQYAVLGRRHAEALLNVDKNITICSSGPYPDAEWCRDAAVPLSDVAPLVSLHHYCVVEPLDFTSKEACHKTYHDIIDRTAEYEEWVLKMRQELPLSVAISLDEWNVWYGWYRNPGAAEGIFTARFYLWLFNAYRKYNIACACYFEAVNEGAIRVDARKSELTANGQVMALMSPHAGGIPCELWNTEKSFATRHENGIYMTVLNDSDTENMDFTLPASGIPEKMTLWTASNIYPGSRFVSSELQTENSKVTLPPLSLLTIWLKQ